VGGAPHQPAAPACVKTVCHKGYGEQVDSWQIASLGRFAAALFGIWIGL